MTAPAISLIYPPSNAVTVMPSLGLGYLASALRNAGFGVAIYDLPRRHVRLDDLYERLSRVRPKYVGLSVSTPNYLNSVKVARMIRRLPYRPTLILGGPHVSVYPEQALKEFAGDFVVLREAEESLVNLLRVLENAGDPAGVKGICRLADGHATRTEPQPLKENLDELAWPAWDLIEPDRYPPIPHQLFVRHLPVAPVITTRGCPFGCKFCAATFLFGNKVRRRSPADVVDEMAYLADKFGIREFHIEDDNPTLIREHITSFCREISSSPKRFVWKFPNGVMPDTLDEPLMRMLLEAGCYQISLGIETCDERADIGKDLHMEKVREVASIAKNIGMQTVGLFVLGLPGETGQIMRGTVAQAFRLRLDFAHFGIYVPLPGSAWGEKAYGERQDFRDINFFTATQRTRWAKMKVKWWQRLAVFSFYIRPGAMLKVLKMIKPRQISGFLHTFRRYIIG